jgi:hypothetical protein
MWYRLVHSYDEPRTSTKQRLHEFGEWHEGEGLSVAQSLKADSIFESKLPHHGLSIFLSTTLATLATAI